MFFKKKRLETERDNLQKEWDLRQEKLTRLRVKLVTEASEAQKFDLEKTIEQEQSELKNLKKRLNSIEEKLSHLESTGKSSEGPHPGVRNELVYYIFGFGVIFLAVAVIFFEIKPFNYSTTETSPPDFPKEKPDIVDEDGSSFLTRDNQIFSTFEIEDISSVSRKKRVAITNGDEVGIWQIWQSEEGLFSIDRSNSEIIKREELISNRNSSVIKNSEIEASVIYPRDEAKFFAVIDVRDGERKKVRIAQKDSSNIRFPCYLENDNVDSELYNVLINTEKEYIVISNNRDNYAQSQVHVLWLDNGGVENCRSVAQSNNGSLNLRESGENINSITRIISTLLDPVNKNGFITAHRSGQLFRWNVDVDQSSVDFKERLLKDSAEDLSSAGDLLSVEFSPDGQYLTLGYSNEIYIWKRNGIFRNDLKPFKNFTANDLGFAEITWAGLSGSGEILIAAGRNNDSEVSYHIKFQALSQTDNGNTVDCVAYTGGINEVKIVSGKENKLAILSAGENADSSYSVKLWNYNDLENNESCFE